MLTIQNVENWEKIRGVAYAPYAFASYAAEALGSYLLPVMGSVRDWPKVVLVYLGLMREAEITLRDGRKERITKADIRALVMNVKGVAKLSLDYRKRVPKPLSFYEEVNADGKMVVDVGAYIGDTAIYFIERHGAKSVVAFEPVESLYRIAVENIRARHLQKRIELVKKEVVGDASAGDKSFSLSLGGGHGTIKLKSLIKRYRVRNAVLKIDCEGCEFGLLKGLPSNSCDVFEEIVVRYYRGYKNIAAMLEALGYKVKHTKPEYKFANMFKNFTARGVVLATRAI